ncbi:MAG: 2,3-bisphosphoglycerate-independent phosphoglycerate mutase, partial [Endomicrobia bacterium]|nr:2,3-bisphosphoglycerate-independent phosphoglycerate mutase [Endomicrobiia bacterium]
MYKLEIIKSLALKNDKKIVFLVIDGLGGATHPQTKKTELEIAYHPNLNNLASKSLCGLAIPVDYGITPGSGPGHLALFGYNPVEYLIGRGVLEVLGLGMEMKQTDLAFRGNFATIDKEGVIVDRRAGRIPTEETVRLIEKISKNITKIDDVEVILKPGKEHRFAGILRHNNLVEDITENDPHKEGNKPHKIQPTTNTENAKFTAEVVEKFISQVAKLLKDEPKANYILLRGFAKYPDIPKMQQIYKLTPVAIAVYPMYKGLAQIVGMEVLHGCETINDEIAKLKEVFNKPYDFYYIHIKDTDKLGEDGNFDAKVKKIEEIDQYIPEILSLKPDVLVITGDHSTPAVVKGHSWHPVPVLIWSKEPPTPE